MYINVGTANSIKVDGTRLELSMYPFKSFHQKYKKCIWIVVFSLLLF